MRHLKRQTKSLPLNPSKQGDVESLRHIVSSLEDLRQEAKKAGVEDVEMIIGAAHKMCASLYYLQIRGELVEEERLKG